MKEKPLHLTMRELQALVRSPLLWVALGGTACIFGIAGPFGTYEALSLPARLAYWAVIITVTYLVCYAVVTFLQALLCDRPPSPLVYAAFGTAASPLAAGIVWIVNASVFGAQGIAFLPLLAYIAIVATIISGMVAFFSRSLEASASQEPSDTTIARPSLMDRLPPEKRGTLHHLSMQDHYVEIVTSAGSHLVLMRLSDAIAETGGIDGVQIHRSHWVAVDAVRQVVRKDERMTLILVNGAELPVSRARMKDVREKGLA